MSESTPEGGTTSGETPAANEFEPITSQEDLNKVISDRIQRERAKYADYKDVKAKAAKLDEIEDANRSEAEKQQARLTELETELNAVRSESMRLRIASEHGITDSDDIALFLTGADEETLTKQAKRLSDRDADRKKNGNHVPREGATNTKPGDDPMRDVVAQLFADPS